MYLRCCDPETQKLHSRCHDFDEDTEPAPGVEMMYHNHTSNDSNNTEVMNHGMEGHASKRAAEYDYEGYDYWFFIIAHMASFHLLYYRALFILM